MNRTIHSAPAQPPAPPPQAPVSQPVQQPPPPQVPSYQQPAVQPVAPQQQPYAADYPPPAGYAIDPVTGFATGADPAAGDTGRMAATTASGRTVRTAHLPAAVATATAAKRGIGGDVLDRRHTGDLADSCDGCCCWLIRLTGHLPFGGGGGVAETEEAPTPTATADVAVQSHRQTRQLWRPLKSLHQRFANADALHPLCLRGWG